MFGYYFWIFVLHKKSYITLSDNSRRGGGGAAVTDNELASVFFISEGWCAVVLFRSFFSGSTFVTILHFGYEFLRDQKIVKLQKG